MPVRLPNEQEERAQIGAGVDLDEAAWIADTGWTPLQILAEAVKWDSRQEEAGGGRDVYGLAAMLQGLGPAHASAALKTLCDQGHEIANYRDCNDDTVLHAAANASTEVSVWLVELLLTFGSNPNAQDQLGWSALHCAASNPRQGWALIEPLLAAGADIELLANNSGKTPIMCAKHRSLELLASRGANIDAVDGGGNTLLSQAIKGGSVEDAEVLLRLGADPTLHCPSTVPNDPRLATMLRQAQHEWVLRTSVMAGPAIPIARL